MGLFTEHSSQSMELQFSFAHAALLVTKKQLALDATTSQLPPSNGYTKSGKHPHYHTSLPNRI